MKNIYLLVFALFGLLLTSCKDKDKDPKPVAGSIRASVTPAGSVTAMEVTAGGTIYKATADGSNTFFIGNLPPGQYTVSFKTSTAYKEPAKRMAEVTQSHETNLGTIAVEKIIDTGSFTAKLNGNSWMAPFPIATLNNGSLILTGTQVSTTGDSEVITLILQNFNGVGVYTGPAEAMATFTEASIMGGNMQNWASAMGQCVVNITAYNASTKVVTGTFNFVATPADANASGTKTVTDGMFTNVSIQ